MYKIIIKHIEMLNMFIKYITHEKCECDIRHIIDNYNDGCSIMAQQTLIIRFDLSDYTIIDELIENKINVKYWYQAPFKSFDNDDIIISRENNNIKFNNDIGICDLDRFNCLDI